MKRPGGDAAVVRINDAGKALALATDATPRYCRADPVRGGAQAVAESWRNLTAVGALPLALTDNMNFGNPEKPEIMGEFVGAVEGMREACLALDYPVVSGNVSLYNETSGSAILPAPVIGGVGLIADASQRRRSRAEAGWRCADPGRRYPRPSRRLAVPARDRGKRGGPAAAGRSRRRAQATAISSATMIDGGPCRRLPRCRRMAACSSRSPRWRWPAAAAPRSMPSRRGLPPHAWLFGEDQARYLIETADPERCLGSGRRQRVYARNASARSAAPR